MKKYILIIMAVFTIFLFSCDAFLIPKEERLNPYDINNPLAQADILSTEVSLDDGGRFITVSWAETGNDAEQTGVGYLVIRKTGSAAETIFDGTPLPYTIPRTEILSFTDYEFVPGVRNYYSIFTYGYKAEYSDESISLGVSPEGSITDFEYFNFTPPAVTYADPNTYLDRTATDDGYVFTDNVWNNAGDDPLLVATSTSTAQFVTCLTFDLSAPDTGEVKKVTMILTLNNSPMSGSGEIEIGPLRNSWSTSTLFNDLDDSGALDTVIYYAYEQRLPCDGIAGDTWEIDITNIYRAFQNGDIANNGIRLISFNGTNTFYFDSLEGTNRPYIRIESFEG